MMNDLKEKREKWKNKEAKLAATFFERKDPKNPLLGGVIEVTDDYLNVIKVMEKIDKLTADVGGEQQTILKSLLSTLVQTLDQLKAIGADETRIPKALLDYKKQKDVFDSHYDMLDQMFKNLDQDIKEEYGFVRKEKTEL